jgi:hypothetical protein
MTQKSLNKKNTAAEPKPPEAPAEKAIAVAEKPGELATPIVNPFGKFAGRGMETVDLSLIKIPHLILVDKQSTGVSKKGDPLYGQVGNFFDPLTGMVYDGQAGFVGVAVSSKKTYVERTPNPKREFVGKHDPDSEFVKASIARTKRENDEKPDTHGYGKLIAPEGKNQVIETHEVLMVLAPCDEKGEPDYALAFPTVVRFASSAIPGYSRWISGITTNRMLPDGTKLPAGSIPMFAYEFRLTAKAMEGSGNEWNVPFQAPVRGNIRMSIGQGPLYEEAVALIGSMEEGKAVIDEASEHAVKSEGDAEGEAPAAKKMTW